MLFFVGGLTPFDSSLELPFWQKWSMLLCRERKIFLREVKTQRYLDQTSIIAPWKVGLIDMGLHGISRGHRTCIFPSGYPVCWCVCDCLVWQWNCRWKTENYFVFHWYWKHSSSLLLDLVTFQRKLTSSYLEQSLVARYFNGVQSGMKCLSSIWSFSAMESHPWGEVFVRGTAPAQRQSCYVLGSDVDDFEVLIVNMHMNV